MDRVFVGDIVRRCSGYTHGNHLTGHICRVERLIGETGRHFTDNLEGSYSYSVANYELVSRGGPPEKKRSGFGKWIKRHEVPESNT